MDRRRIPDGRVRKRKAENTLSDDRLTKRLESLKLEAQAKVRPQLYAHIQRRPSQVLPTPVSIEDAVPNAAPAAPGQLEDGMEVEETKNRVYISNLAKEIAEIEAAEEAAKKTIFIPDVEKKFLPKIAIGVYANKDGEIGGMNRDQALVLYDFPKSLTVEESKDSARKAILEARRRAQEKAGLAVDRSTTGDPPALLDMDANADTEVDDGGEPMALEENGEDDGDVMEVDEEL